MRRVIQTILAAGQDRWWARRRSSYDDDMHFTEAVSRFPNRNRLYAYMHHYFNHLCPVALREHRKYFKSEGRGFGEDAFHAMWWLLLREFKPRNCLEIGVYRGQVISLWSLIATTLGFSCDVSGISPFTAAGDAVSEYRDDVDYQQDTIESFSRFGLSHPVLVGALSADPEAISHVLARKWDLIYIDGSHDFEVVLADYCLCRDRLHPGGLLVLDDASLGTAYRPPLFAFAGHPGPSRVAAEYAMKELNFLGAVGHNNVFRKPITMRETWL